MSTPPARPELKTMSWDSPSSELHAADVPSGPNGHQRVVASVPEKRIPNLNTVQIPPDDDPGWQPQEEPDDMLERATFVDVAAFLAGGLPKPPQPVSVRRQDGQALFYPGRTNIIFGDPESGKTWLAYAAVTETLAQGGSAAVIDADHNGSDQVIARLMALGAHSSVLGDPQRFRLAEPEDGSHLRAVVAETALWAPTVAVVDSVGEVLPLLGLNSNSADDYTAANRGVLLPLAKSGAVVIAVDHLAKAPDSRAAGATGTAAKRRTVGGLSLRVSIREPFAPGRGGTAALTVHKDRPGAVRAASPAAGREQPAGLFVLNPVAGGLRWHVTKPTVTDVAPRFQARAEDIAEVDALPADRRTVRGVREVLGCGQDRAQAVLDAWRAGL